MSKMLKKLKKEHSGEIMIESCIIILITIFLLIAILSLGFAYYQQAMIKTVANETAEMVAANYKYTSQEDIANVELNDDTIKEIKMYRTTFQVSKMAKSNKCNAEKYVPKRINITNLGINESDPTIDYFSVEVDKLGRTHVDVEVSMKTQILFQGALDYFGIFDGTPTYTASARAQCLDITGHAAMVSFTKYIDNKIKESDLGQTVVNITNIINDIKHIAGNVRTIADMLSS
jgi:hypothetical protein